MAFLIVVTTIFEIGSICSKISDVDENFSTITTFLKDLVILVKVIRISEQVVVNRKFLIFANELFYLSRYSGKNRNGALPTELKALTCQLKLIIDLKANIFDVMIDERMDVFILHSYARNIYEVTNFTK